MKIHNKTIEDNKIRHKFMESVMCIFCGKKRSYSEKYDSYYCNECLYWLERICPDRTCEFCKDKPKYPSKDQW